jgi:3-hydroxybutyrate dehydrogenase
LIEPQEVADLVLMLCSENSKSITGSNLTIDGGWTAQ